MGWLYLLALLLVAVTTALGFKVLPAHAQGARYGADYARMQGATTAAGWPQQHSTWCGPAVVAAVADYAGNQVTQSAVNTTLQTPSAEWGTPTNPSGGFPADIARDFGTDPRALAAAQVATTPGNQYHQRVVSSSAYGATTALVADLVRSQQPITVFVDHGQHNVLVSAVFANDNPATNLGSITDIEVWDPGVGAGAGIQTDVVAVVSLATWLTSPAYWGLPYDSNNGLDPDPAVGAYSYDSAIGAHLWIGQYVYIRPDSTADASWNINPDWAFNGSGALIKGWHGETPAGYAGPVALTEGLKTTLNELSPDAPSLWTEAANVPAQPTGAPVAALAWTGTDTPHHLNVMLSTDGLHYGQKLTLGESSFARPSIVVMPVGGASVVVIAWAGDDPAHSLNVLYDVYGATGAPQKKTFSETSPFAPTMTAFAGQVWLGWAGSDPAHTLNVLALGAQGVQPGAKKILSGYASTTGPVLTADVRDNRLLLAWQRSDNNRLDALQSGDGASWSALLSSPSPQTSNVAPPLLSLNLAPSTMAPYYWGWTGTDSAHSLNLSRSTTLANWLVPVTTFNEQATGAPAIGYAGHPDQVLLAWTGTDASHHLNIALIQD